LDKNEIKLIIKLGKKSTGQHEEAHCSSLTDLDGKNSTMIYKDIYMIYKDTMIYND